MTKLTSIQNNDTQQKIFDKQEELQSRFGVVFPIEDRQKKAEYIKDQIFWTIDELSELTHEVPFIKHWKSYDLTEEEYDQKMQLAKEEFVDAWHFMSNIGLALGFTSKELLQMYNKKNKVNHERQDNGY